MGTPVEYAVLEGRFVYSADSLAHLLNGFGGDGWQLITVNGAGDYILSRTTAALPDTKRSSRRRSKRSSMTKREMEVAKLIAEGMGNRQVSQTLGLKEQSVKNLVSAAMRKVGAENRTQLVLHYLKESGTPPSKE